MKKTLKSLVYYIVLPILIIVKSPSTMAAWMTNGDGIVFTTEGTNQEASLMATKHISTGKVELMIAVKIASCPSNQPVSFQAEVNNHPLWMTVECNSGLLLFSPHDHKRLKQEMDSSSILEVQIPFNGVKPKPLYFLAEGVDKALNGMPIF